MSEIPQDVMAKARASASEVGSLGRDDPSFYDLTQNIVARAIMAERERCAAVCERPHRFTHDNGDGTSTLTFAPLPSGLGFAAAIRSGQ